MRPTSVILHLSAAVSSFKNIARVPWIRSDNLKLRSTSHAQMTTYSESTPSFDNIIDSARWIDLEISPTELRPNYTLIMGQCFNWKRIDNADTDGTISTCWIGILGTYPLAIRQTDETTLFANLMDSRTVHSTSSSDKYMKRELTSVEFTLKSLLRNYFQTDHSLESLYISWANGCNRMLAVTEALKGVRVVRQDPFECLISFICSSNNNIKRISLMLDRLRCRYGKYICTVSYVETESSKLEGQNYKNIWKVSVIENHGEVLRNDLKRSLLMSPSKLSSGEAEDDTFQSPMAPTPGRKRAATPKTPVLEPILLHHHIFEFPSIEDLSLATEAELRGLGMGYRAKFISGSAQFLAAQVEGGAQWLSALRVISASREVMEVANSIKVADRVIKTEGSKISSGASSGTKVKEEKEISGEEALKRNRLFVQSQLMLMPGVGRKVADCVALFSLDQVEAIPVDTHVWDIALRDYDPSLSLKGAKSITPTIYEEVGDVFRNRFTTKAGWAHSVLFAAELPEFRRRLPVTLQEEMKAFVEQSKSAKKVDGVVKLEKRKVKLEIAESSIANDVTSPSPRSGSVKKRTRSPALPPAVDIADQSSKRKAKTRTAP